MNESKGPYKKSKSGRFQVSLFKFDRILGRGNDFQPEQVVEQVRVSVQYSYFKNSTNRWERDQIWCSPEELRDLGIAISGLSYVTPEERIA
jgi:hypothetical protein